MTIIALFMVLSMLPTGCGQTDKPAYTSPEKLGDYLYYIEYNDFVPEIAGDLAPSKPKADDS